MAWLQNLTGQAEKFLNKIDKKAADVLNDPSIKSNQKFAEENDVCVTIPGTYFTPENVGDLSNEEIAQFQVVSDVIPESDIEEIKGIASDKELSESVTGSPVKPDINDNSSALQSKMLWDELVKPPSTSSKSESVLHSFSSVEDVQKHLERISKLEFDNDDLNKQLLNIQHLYSEIRNENSILRNNLERANEMVNAAESEMEQYKARAHRILQEKEKLISLKTDEIIRENSEENIYVNYNEELKNELKFQQDKNEEINQKMTSLNSELISLQQQYVVMQNMLQKSIKKTENELFNERRMLNSVEEELKLKSQELNEIQQEVAQKNLEILSKTREVEELKSHLKQRVLIVNNEDLECRIQNLTETLMMKQNQLETITSERNALRLQLEKLENEYHRNLLLTRNSQPKFIHVNDTDDVKLQIPQLMRVSPLDAGVTKRVKRAYSSLDALSIRTGVFLRRYPGIRVFVFCYMVLLHFWVLVVLLNYAPTMK